MFKEFNKESKVEAELQNSKFYIDFKDFKKTFNQFYIKFTIIIISLNINKRKKISYLKKIIS